MISWGSLVASSRSKTSLWHGLLGATEILAAGLDEW
jgi:hypothetical protein